MTAAQSPDASVDAGPSASAALGVAPEDVEGAAAAIEGFVRTTPVMAVTAADLGAPAGRFTVKLEMLQHSGSFKARGVAHHFQTRSFGPQGVVAASGGNHGVAVAWGAAKFGHRADVFVPVIAAEAKVARLHRYGAVVHRSGAVFADALRAALDHVDRSGGAFLHPYDDPVTIAGAGTVVTELWVQTGGFDTVVVACGGGGLAAGMATWLDGRARLIAVEGELTPTLSRALAAGGPVHVDVAGVTADALGASRLGTLAFPALDRPEVTVLTVSDAAVLTAQRRLWENLQLYVEPSAAVGVAALNEGLYQPEPGERVAVVLCGANGDPGSLMGVAPGGNRTHR